MKLPAKLRGPLPHRTSQTRSDDIKGLFRKFDGDPATYQEISHDSRASAAQSRWPILSRLNVGPVTSAPAISLFKPALLPAVATSVQAAPIQPPPVAPHRPKPSKNATPMPAKDTDQARSLSAIFQRLVGPVPAPALAAAPIPKRSMLFNKHKTL
jgi:hypothetical protein